MNIYKIYYHGYEDGSYLFLTHENNYSFEEFEAIFSTCLKEAKKIEEIITQDDQEIWINRYLTNAIDIMIENHDFSLYEVDAKQTVSIFTDTDIIDIKNNKRVY